jgi:hypothetical protein
MFRILQQRCIDKQLKIYLFLCIKNKKIIILIYFKIKNT